MAFKPSAGEVFLNKYEIVSLVGEGAFGSVYRARDIKLDRIVAIKFINIVNDVLERFNDELEAIKGLDHPNIVRLYDFDILKNGMPCMVMEYINGVETYDKEDAARFRAAARKVSTSAAAVLMIAFFFIG